MHHLKSECGSATLTVKTTVKRELLKRFVWKAYTEIQIRIMQSGIPFFMILYAAKKILRFYLTVLVWMLLQSLQAFAIT